MRKGKREPSRGENCELTGQQTGHRPQNHRASSGSTWCSQGLMGRMTAQPLPVGLVCGAQGPGEAAAWMPSRPLKPFQTLSWGLNTQGPPCSHPRRPPVPSCCGSPSACACGP